MTKRTESQSPSKKSRHQRTGKAKRRRMMMESLEQRQLLAAQVFDLPSVTIPTFQQSRDIGTVQAFAISESETGNAFGGNDTIQTADFVPLGTGPGQQDTIDISGSLPITTIRPPISNPDGTLTPQQFSADLDYFSFDLRAGDILDIATLQAAGSFTVFHPDGRLWYAIDNNQAAGGQVFYPENSPLQTLGNAAYAQVVPEDGRYYVLIAPSNVQTSYQVGLRVYRPLVESLPIGAQQYIFLDFDGAVVPQTVLNDATGVPQTGVFRVPSLEESLPFLGLQALDTASINRLIDLTIEETIRQHDHLGLVGNAGDYDRTAIPGDYGVTVLNSRDHVDPGNHPLVTRVVVGGPISAIGLPAGVLGVSSTIDIGNFSMDDTVFVALDGVVASATAFPIANNASVLEATADVMAFIITHEAAHSFGMRHTEPGNNVNSIADAIIYTTEGPDGIYGTLDDEPANFVDDQFRIIEQIVGTNFIVNAMANTLVTGTVGSSVTGRVFNDFNRDGNGANDAGLAGVTVFVDLDNDGVLDPNEASTVSASDGSFTLSAANGTANVVALTPAQFTATTPTSTSVAFGSTSSIAFGFAQVVPDITGTKFADLNDNGIFDANESGIPGVYIYLDLDGDDRPDLGEPAGITAADGTYSINFPGPGTYTIREVIEPGFTQTFPASGEHTVVFDGTALTDNYNFGNSPSRDFGDAPDDGVQFNYRTLSANDGASHGIVAGLSLGAEVDRDIDGIPSVNAMGDDTTGRVLPTGGVLDDEEGVAPLTEPFGLGGTTTLQVTTTNTTGTPAYLQAWMDFNGDGDFADAGEQIATNVLVGTGTIDLPVTVPANAALGTTYARFRYSQTRDLTWFGGADTGEVEDYAFPILATTDTTNPDEFSVSRNSLSNQLNVLANDFETPDSPLSILRLQTVVDPTAAPGSDAALLQQNTRGIVTISNDGRSVLYTPPNGFVGLDQFAYTVLDAFNRESTTLVTVNVTFLSPVPIAVDDIFDVPQGSVNRALNVLDNDVPSTAGGLTITSILPGDRGGTASIVGGGQSIRYTPLPGFTGTEQFIYNVQDSAGGVSMATVTVNMLPGSRADDVVGYTIEILDTLNQQPISSIPVGQDFLVRVLVEDLQAPNPMDGVGSGFLDLLYTDTQVAPSPRPAGSTSAFDFDIEFGPLFRGFVIDNTASQVPGLLNEIGGVQTSLPNQQHTAPTELFTVRMQAVSPGVAIFQGDPANNPVSETIVVGSTEILTPSQLRFGSAELEILPAGTVFSSAIDDSFPNNVDSLNQSFADNTVTNYRLNVLENDIKGPTNNIIDRQILRGAGFGSATFNDNGTPGDLNDDFVEYVPNVGVSEFDSFTYFIVTADGIRSVAEATIAVNDTANDLVDINFVLVDQSGNPINPANGVTVGQTFGVQVNLLDLRDPNGTTPAERASSVFAGYLDLLYSSGLVTTLNTTTDPVFGSDNFDFDVILDAEFQANAAVGSAERVGIIDEFGAFLTQQVAQSQSATVGNLMATVFFQATAAGTARFVGSPADSFPFQDTLLSLRNEVVPVNQIRYDVLEVTISGPQGEFIQNPVRPADVNNDGDLSPLDALLVFNRLSDLAENVQGESVNSSGHYLDVSGNGELSPLDALMVLDALAEARAAALNNSPQGELISDFVDSSSGAGSSSDGPDSTLSDSVFSELSSKAVADDSSVDNGSLAVDSVAIDSSETSEDEDEDGLLNLLADDQLDLGN